MTTMTVAAIAVAPVAPVASVAAIAAIGAFSITVRRVIIIVTRTTPPRHPIENNPGRTATCAGEHPECSLHGVARGFACINHYTDRLNERRHQECVAHRQDRSGVDDNAIV